MKLEGRELCWDKELWDENDGVLLKIHTPTRKNVILKDMPMQWEGYGGGYLSVLKVDGKYRLYYRAVIGEIYDHYRKVLYGNFCVALSDDGKVFTRPVLNKFESNGSKENNIFMYEDRYVDNFTVHYDTNPDCPEDERFKALSMIPNEDFSILKLGYYKSADGINFEFVRTFDLPGTFDTMNVVLWDEKAKLYRMYIRNFHLEDGSTPEFDLNVNMENARRDIRMTTSTDFINWTEPQRLDFGEAAEDIQLYTNQIIKYHRGNMFIGFPTRYRNRNTSEELHNYRYLPKLYENLRQGLLEERNRCGSVQTDCVIMTSRDGFHFNRHDEQAFFKSGLETGLNWEYSSGYLSHGVAETDCDDAPGNKELSVYTVEDNHSPNPKIVRYTVRLDGFLSWYADYNGGTLLTKPFSFTGDSLSINFATSSLGSLRIVICDEYGNALDGYDSKLIFGNSLERPVDFEKSLSELSGKNVRMKITLKDAELYSFEFK